MEGKLTTELWGCSFQSQEPPWSQYRQRIIDARAASIHVHLDPDLVIVIAETEAGDRIPAMLCSVVEENHRRTIGWN